jgi:hypothetical protein
MWEISKTTEKNSGFFSDPSHVMYINKNVYIFFASLVFKSGEDLMGEQITAKQREYALVKKLKRTCILVVFSPRAKKKNERGKIERN